MTWPFENDTSAIVKKLAGRSMQADKRNKAFLLLTIAISVCMVFSILLISTGTQEKFKNTQRNKAQIGILGVTDEQTAQLRQNEMAVCTLLQRAFRSISQNAPTEQSRQKRTQLIVDLAELECESIRILAGNGMV